MVGYLSDSRFHALLYLKRAGHCFCFFFLLCCSCPIAGSSFFEFLDTLTWEEQNDLKIFFHELFAENELGYTLFGDKPMSFCFPSTSVVSFSTKERIFKIYKKGNIPIFNSLSAWNHLKKLTESENFVFISNDKNGFPDSVFLINKPQFISALNENIGILKKEYGRNATAELFLNDLINDKIKIEELLQKHALFGILLGYGRHNAELFQRREDLLSGKRKIPLSMSQKPSKGFISTEAEIESLESKLLPVNTKNTRLLLVKPVNFVADHQDPKTHELVSHYELLHKELTSLFLREDWFPLILEKIGN
jgi:hypothetical protein